MKDNLTVFVDFSARLNAMRKQHGMDSNIRQPTAHKAVEIFFKFIVVLFLGDTARSRCTFLAVVNNVKLTNINAGRNTAKIIIKNAEPRIMCAPLPEIT